MTNKINILTISIDSDLFHDFICGEPVTYSVQSNTAIEAHIGKYGSGLSEAVMLEVQKKYVELSENKSKMYLAKLNDKLGADFK